MPSKTSVIISSSIVFVLLFFIGLDLSRHKVLWIDEFYTQKEIIDVTSYKDLATQNFWEGNRSPLFYIVQKAVSNALHFHLEDQTKGMSKIHNPRAQVIMRLASNFYMSLALAVIFYFFVRYYSIGAGFYSLAVALVTPMVWLYWVEARPYSLWFLLTALQIVLLSRCWVNKDKGPHYALGIVHLLLSLTTIVSLIQIALAIALLVFKRYQLKKLLWIAFLPLAVVLYYYCSAKLFTSKVYDIWGILAPVLLPERLIIFMIYGIIFVLYRKWRTCEVNAFFLINFLLSLASVLGLVLMYWLKKTAQFSFDSRYLIYIVPLDIICMTLIGRNAWVSFKEDKLFLTNVCIFFGGLLIVRGLLTYAYVLSLAVYLHTG